MSTVDGKKNVKTLATTKDAKKKTSIRNDRLGFSAPRNLFKETHLG